MTLKEILLQELETDDVMKESYDFSQGQRGKFYHPDTEFEMPTDPAAEESDESILAGLRPSLQEFKDGKGIPFANLWDEIDSE